MGDCGVIAISSTRDVISDLVKGLVFIQHRGQSHAGICVLDKTNKPQIHKRAGLVLDLINDMDFSKIQGKVGIGHVRYPTVGVGVGQAEAQPIKSQQLPNLILAHNGNLPNFTQTKREFSKKGVKFKSSCDVEALVEVLASNLIKLGYNQKFDPNDELIYEAVKNTMNYFENGSFSGVGIIGNKLFIFRDKRGIKPLVSGRRHTREGLVEYGIASESVGLTQIGFQKKDIWNVEPGHCYIITGSEIRDKRLTSSDHLARCIFEDAYFAHPASTIDGMSVSKRRSRIGRILADEFYKKFPAVVPDIVAPIPDTARTAAVEFAQRLSLIHRDHIPYREVIIRNRYMGLRSFIEASQQRRELLIDLKNVYDVRNIPETLVLVDDSIVRMTTLKKIAKTLKRLGVENLYLAIAFPPIKSPCYYGIDFPDREQLVASKLDIEQIKKELGVDGLYYISLDGYLSAVGTLKDQACLGCTTGKYPTDISEDQKKSCVSDFAQRR